MRGKMRVPVLYNTHLGACTCPLFVCARTVQQSGSYFNMLLLLCFWLVGCFCVSWKGISEGTDDRDITIRGVVGCVRCLGIFGDVWMMIGSFQGDCFWEGEWEWEGGQLLLVLLKNRRFRAAWKANMTLRRRNREAKELVFVNEVSIQILWLNETEKRNRDVRFF